MNTPVAIQNIAEILLPLGKQALVILVQILGAVLGSAPVWGPIAWKLLGPLARAALMRATNAQTLAAFDALEASVKPAVNVAMESIQADMLLAKRPESAGGAVVTPDEYRAAVAKACAAAWSQLDKAGIIRSVVLAYGGEDQVKRSLQMLVERALFKHHGVTKPAEGPPAVVTPPVTPG